MTNHDIMVLNNIITLVKDAYQFCSYLLFFVWLLIAYTFYCSCCSVTELWCLTLCHRMDCSLIGSSVHRIFPGKDTGVGCHFLLQENFLAHGLNLHFLHWQASSSPMSHQGSLYIYVYRLYRLL